MDVSSASSFYEPPVQYEENKTVELYEKLKTNLQDVEGLLGSVQKNLRRVEKESTLTVKLIEKMKSVQTVENQNENQNTNQSKSKSQNQSRNKSQKKGRKSK